MGKNVQRHLPLFETKNAYSSAKVQMLYGIFVLSVVVGICLVGVYRATHVPPRGDSSRWAWICISIAELFCFFYWLIRQLLRLNPIIRTPFTHRLRQRYRDEELPGVDVFVCTADDVMEPPAMVINTVLSLMAYDYPPEKLNVYLSDDGGSQLMFYALLEASTFSKHWLPFCRKYKVEPRSPAAFFAVSGEVEPPPADHSIFHNDYVHVKRLYEDMVQKIEDATKLGKVSEEVKKQHKGFNEWCWVKSKNDHQTIVQILIDGRDKKSVDVEGKPLPSLVYLSREKRPNYHHNFKAGALNALIRVSSRISNSPLVLTMDCDMYSNNSASIRETLCFFMDEEKGQDIAYVQFPQCFNNIKRNDIYSNTYLVPFEVEFYGLDGNGGMFYIGSGCFHRRDILCGKSYEKNSKFNWNKVKDCRSKDGANLLEETCKVLASCTHEENTPWGKEIGVRYGIAAEDGITGLSILSKGWRSIYYNPSRKGFLGLAPTTLPQTLLQQLRWSQALFHIFCSKYSPFICGFRRLPLTFQFSSCLIFFWALNSLTSFVFAIIPSFCLLKESSLFPKATSCWALPYAYIVISIQCYNMIEFVRCGGTYKGWWNDQRMWLYKGLTSHLLGLFETIWAVLGFTKITFVITTKSLNDEGDESKRYEQEKMEFGPPSPTLSILSTMALFNLLSLVWTLTRLVSAEVAVVDSLILQTIFVGILVIMNLPLYEGMFFRMDKGSIHFSTTCQSLVFALIAHSLAIYTQ